jgi:type I restriction enzyme R subunit
MNQSGYKLIDLENFDNNSFHVVTELTYKSDDAEFRPDIVLLINGMPLVFIEVKKPNSKDGIKAEYQRTNERFQDKKLRRFANITQLMVFSNNMEYDEHSSLTLQGSFYAAPSYHHHSFNYFREEEKLDLSVLLAEESEENEKWILKDNNLQIIRNSPEFITNKNPNNSTNRLLTSLFCRERLQFLLKYAIAYVSEEIGVQKQIMRYPQFFAVKAIEQKLEDGVKKGIIWHTQGSGKTALAFYCVKFLTDYFQKKKTIPKFYFIVDRIDLLNQAKKEFSSRGLVVHAIESKEAFTKDIKSVSAIHNTSGIPEITVVNIHKFEDDPDVVRTEDYAVNIQRIYFLDEVHRSYNPKGSFLANLNQSDRQAIHIGLTGTPLLGNDYNSRMLFGDYIHKYYYNSSIADGYTLRLIREEIATNYKLVLQEALAKIEVAKGEVKSKDLFSDRRYVEPLLDYILKDFAESRYRFQDNSIGGMVICQSLEQAKELYAVFNERLNSQRETSKTSAKIEDYQAKNAALILHNHGTEEERDHWREEFKEGRIDLLFVNQMLLTGFDAKRLKKLYLGRVITGHTLLQALTRVNRPYKNFRYGFVVDFVDIRQEFDLTNQAYFDELQAELGDEFQHYSNLFKSQEEIEAEIEEIKDILFRYNTDDLDLFSQQISQIQDRESMLSLKKTLENAKNLYNLIRLTGQNELLERLPFRKLNELYREVSNRLDLINLRERSEAGADMSNLLNEALEDVIFSFVKVGEEELVLADQLKNTLRRTREAFVNNFDKYDPVYLSLQEELERLFESKKLNEVSQAEMTENMQCLNKIYEKIKELNRQNNLLRSKYNNDVKYVRLHKRLLEWGKLSQTERKICEVLTAVKDNADNLVSQRTHILKDNEEYFNREMMRLLIRQFNLQKINLNVETSRYINHLIVKEYLNEFNGLS